MSLLWKGVFASGLLLGSCISGGQGAAGDVPIPPIDARAPQVFETATFSLG